MAIDGVKIIDSDDGHDIYNAIVERYKDGVSVDTIISEILSEKQNFCTDEFYTEIYWTANGLFVVEDRGIYQIMLKRSIKYNRSGPSRVLARNR